MTTSVSRSRSRSTRSTELEQPYDGFVREASIRASRASISRSNLAVSISKSDGACWDRDTNVLVIAAVITVRNPIPTNMTRAATRRPETVYRSHVTVADRRDRLDCPPKTGADRWIVRSVCERHQHRRPESDRNRRAGDNDRRASRSRCPCHSAIQPPLQPRLALHLVWLLRGATQSCQLHAVGMRLPGTSR